MKTKPIAHALLLASVLTGWAATADEPLPREVTALDEASPKEASARISSRFTAFAGSDDNAGALVVSLRDGTETKLITTTADGHTVTTAFTPATGKQGCGNVYLSLALAQNELTRLGITQPTPEQIQAALNGGPVTVNGQTTQLPGVLALRAQGQGWGQIAHRLNVRLGTVVSEHHRNPAATPREHPAHDRPPHVDKPADRPERPERPVRPERPERADKPGRH